MKNEKKIKKVIKEIYELSEEWYEFVNACNENAYTDDIVQKLIKLGKKLKKLDDERWADNY